MFFSNKRSNFGKKPHELSYRSNIIGNAEMGGFTPPAVLSGRCSFRLLFVSIDGTRPGSSVFPLLWRSQKMDRFVDRLKRRIVFSRWYPTISRKMEKIVASDGRYFESEIGNHFLRIKPQILGKNGGSKDVHLIIITIFVDHSKVILFKKTVFLITFLSVRTV